VSDIVLSGYTTGTAFPSTFDIAPHSSTDISLYYVGHAPGHYIGLVDVLCNINRLTLFTEVNVGSTNPKSVELTTSTYDIISQDFQVDHAGGYFKDFAVNFGVYNPSNGFTNTSHVGKTNDVFNITFDPDNLANGTYVSTATVTVNPMDSSVEPSVFKTHMTVHLNVDNRHVADWTSAILGTNTVLHLSYDIIGGRKYFTAGIGSNTAPISELRGRHTEFPSWQEVYRIPLGDVLAKFYSKDYLAKSQPNFTYGNYFGVGTGKGSILNVEYDGKGNLEILMNALFEIPAANATEAQDLSTALRYYDSRRAHQLQNSSGLTQGGQTYMFVGFDRSGDTLTSLVSPN
jgi:hypothetical protein